MYQLLFWNVFISAALCSVCSDALGVHTLRVPRSGHRTFLVGQRTRLDEIGGAEGLASSSDNDVVVAGTTMEVWCDSRHSSPLASHLASCDAIIVDRDDTATMEAASDNNSNHPTYYHVETTNDQFTDRLICSKTNQLIGIIVNITSEKGLQRALEAIGSVQWILAYTDNDNDVDNDTKHTDHSFFGSNPWLMIPAENLIAAASQSGTKIAFMVDRVPDVVGLSQALQFGVDALCLKINDANNKLQDTVLEAQKQRQEQAAVVDTTSSRKVQELNKETTAIVMSGPSMETTEKESTKETMSIVSGSCWRKPLSDGSASSSVIADRVCIDFVRNLAPTEGVWLGSSSKLMALVLSEAATSSFVPSRPFRVNAGPVHSYVTLADGTRTKYLSELQAGDEVLVYDSSTGQERSVAIGRLKMEVRPCVLVGLQLPQEDSDSSGSATTGQIFLQQAETVRLGQQEGFHVRVTDLDVATSPEEKVEKCHDVLLRVASSGTHVGGRYAGKVDER